MLSNGLVTFVILVTSIGLVQLDSNSLQINKQWKLLLIECGHLNLIAIQKVDFITKSKINAVVVFSGHINLEASNGKVVLERVSFFTFLWLCIQYLLSFILVTRWTFSPI